MLGFLTLPLASIIVPLLAIPVLTSQLGAKGWAATAVSQSIGLFFAGTIGNWGWALIGPARVASSSEAVRTALFRNSVETRLVTTLLAAVLAGTAAFLVLGRDLSAAAIASTSSLVALFPTWYYIGVGSAFLIGLFDVMPKIAAVVAMVVLLPRFASGYTVAVCQAVASLLAIVVSTLYTGGVWRPQLSASGVRQLKENLSLVGSGIIGGGYTSLAGSVVALVKPSALPLFAAGYKVRELGSAGLGAVTNSLRAWVSSSASSRGCPVDISRSRRALVTLSGLGLLGGAAVAAFLPSVDSWLFSDEIQVPYSAGVLVAIALILISGSMSLTYFFFAPAGLRAPIAISLSAASLSGVFFLVSLTPIWGAVGGLLAVVFGEATCFVVQLFFLKRLKGADVQAGLAVGRADCTANVRASAGPVAPIGPVDLPGLG